MIKLVNGRNVTIPDVEIEKAMKSLGLTKEEAIEMWLEDEGYLENEEQEALTKKAKDSGILNTIHEAKGNEPKKKRENVRKEDPTKEKIIADLAEFIKNFAENVEIVNVGKLITFKVGDDTYKLDLIRQRKAKK